MIPMINSHELKILGLFLQTKEAGITEKKQIVIEGCMSWRPEGLEITTPLTNYIHN
jgi:hypothetical protein